MDEFIHSLSRQGRKLKDRLKGNKHKRDRKGANTAGERGDSSGSLLRPEPRVVAGGRDGEGSRTSADVPQVRSKDRSSQPEPMPTGGNDDDDDLWRGEANVSEKEVSREYSRLDPDVGAVVGSRPSREVEQGDPPSDPPIPHNGKPEDT